MKKILFIISVLALIFISCNDTKDGDKFTLLEKRSYSFGKEGGTIKVIAKDAMNISLLIKDKEITDFGFKAKNISTLRKEVYSVNYYLDGNFEYKIKSNWFTIIKDFKKPKEFTLIIEPLKEVWNERILKIGISAKGHTPTGIYIEQKADI